MKHLRTVIPYFRPYRRVFVVGLVLVAVSNVFTILGPYLLKLAIDALEAPEVARDSILRYAFLVVAVAILGGAARFGMRKILNSVSRRIECDLRADFFRHLLRLDQGFYQRYRTGDIMSRATNDTLAVRQAAGPAVMYSVNTTVLLAFCLSLMLWISPRLTLLALLPMLALPPLVLTFGRIIHRRFQRIQEQFSSLSAMVQENLTGVRLVRAYGQEGPQRGEFNGLNRQYKDRNLHLVRASGAMHPTMGLLTGAAMVIVVWIGGLEVMAGRITIGDFVAFMFYLNLLTWPMIALGWVVNLFQRGEASMARINEVLTTDPAIGPPPTVPSGVDGAGSDGPRIDSSVTAAPGAGGGSVTGRIEFRDVSFRYPGAQDPVLANLSFMVEPGETVALVGPTGAGKSTLLGLIPRLHDPTEGEVLLDGRPLHSYHPGELRAAMGIVLQDPFLFSETIRDNIAVGSGSHGNGNGSALPQGDGELGPAEPDGDGTIPREIVEAARTAQIDEQIRAFPHGYDTYLGERGINLSGGQKQRTTLARALARDPRILLLDDALSAVDTRTEARILRELRDARQGRTTFIVSHRMSAVMDADRILVLEDGRLVESGTHTELVERGGTYARLLRRQMLERDLEGREPEVRSAPE